MRNDNRKSAFVTSDSQRFNTKEEAYEHEKASVINNKLNELGSEGEKATKEQITEKLTEAATRYPGYKMLLEKESDWTEWSIFQIKNIREDIFDKNIKIRREKR